MKKSKKAWKRKWKKQFNNLAILMGIIAFVILCAFIKFHFSEDSRRGKLLSADYGQEWEERIVKEYLTVNEYSRPGIPLKKVKGIVVHYVGNPSTTAQDNRNYFEGLKDSHTTKASSHFIIGMNGSIIQCIPLDEISYASNNRNKDTISIECCHPGEDGKYTEETYQSLIDLLAWLCDRYGLKAEDIIRHYDVTGKLCPLYYVEHPDQWEQLRKDVEIEMDK